MKPFHKTALLLFLLSSHAISAQAAERQISILQNGIYDGYGADAVAHVKNDEQWTAIIHSDKGYEAKKVRVSIKNMPSDCMEEKAISISSDPKALLLIQGLAINDGPLTEYTAHSDDALLESIINTERNKTQFNGVVMASDLNNDGYPDFVLTLSSDSFDRRALFLSTVNDDGVSYHKAAEGPVGGC